MDVGSRPVRTAGVAAPALPGCGRRRQSLARGIVGGCRRQRREHGPLGGKHPAPPKSDSIRPYGVCRAGRRGAGKGDAAPGCEGNKILAQRPKSRGVIQGLEARGALPAALSATYI